MTGHDPQSLYQFDPQWGEPVDLRLSRPVLVVGLEGWVDAGMGASAAIAELLTSSPATLVASFDTEILIDQRARRPIARLEDGVTTELTWPAIRMVAGKDRVGADVLYLTGPEPDFRWPTFIEAVVGLVRDLKVRTVVGLGAFPAPTPHTRPVRLASTVPPQSAELAGRVGTVHGTLEVPAGVQAALEVSLGFAGIPVIGLWARVPHYVSAMPYPEASAALIEGLCAVTGTVLDSSSLRSAGEASRRQVDELIGANPEHLEMVRRLEAALDSEEVSPVGLDVDVPSGDEIAAELEQFLKGEGH
jgi:hypothetical protein